jgi:inosine/xanthosine triphosphatase
MDKINVAVGSTRRPKLNAVWESLSIIGPTLDPNALFDVLGFEVDSGVGHTPTSREELMRGARQRAEALVQMGRERGEAWRYFVGLEGGFDVVPDPEGSGAVRRVLLESWAYVTDGARGYYGRSGGIEVPALLAEEVVDRGVELSEAIDRFAGGKGIRDAQGAWGVLSSNLITRQDAFRVAVVSAFAPFYNSKLYG